MKRSQRRVRVSKTYLVTGLVVVLTLVGVILFQTTYAMNGSLPGGLDAEAGGKQGAIELHLKNLDAAQVERNKIGAYYPGNDSSANGKSITISAGLQGRICNIGSAITGSVYVKIAIAGTVTPNSGQYNIPIQQLCDTNQFYNHTFPFPNGTLIKDPKINRYMADIQIIYNTNLISGSVDNNSINYKMSISGDNQGKGILALKRNGQSNQFGMRSSYTNDTSKADSNTIRLAVPFGYACSESVDTIESRQVKLYDADAVFGDTYMWVEKDGQKLPYEAYGYTSRVDRWEGAAKRWKLAGSNNDENVLTIKPDYIERGAKYELVMTNPGTNVDNKPSPYSTSPVHWNTLSVGIPQDSIYIQDKCDYDLRPTISIDQSSYIYYPNIRADSTVINTGGGPITEGHAWEIYAVRFAGTPWTDLRDDATNEAPCGGKVMPEGATGCGIISTATYTGSGVHSAQYASGGPDAVGTRLCFFARVQNPTHWAGDDDLWKYSNLACAVSSKKPRVQFLGSDLRVGGSATSTTFNVQGNNYGSWVEYGMFTSGVNSMVASGNGLRGGNPDGTVSNWNRLTFANTPSYGGYSPVPAASSAYAYFRSLQAGTANLKVNDPDSGVYELDNSANLGVLNVNANGRSVIIRKSGTLRINNNIVVDNNGVTSANNLSQVVLVADNIEINQNVDRIDAWLVTRPTGYIDTCGIGTANLTSNICSGLLTVNGPIYTSKLMLRRTGGANPPGAAQLAEPAERFNLRPDAQLWAYTYANKADYAQTDFVQELPPRY